MAAKPQVVPARMYPLEVLDMQHCPNCGGGELKINTAISDRPVIKKILNLSG